MTRSAPGDVVGRSWREAVRASGGEAFVTYHLAPSAVREVRTGDGWWSVGFAATGYFERGGLLLGGDLGRVAAVVEELSLALRPAEVTVDVRVPTGFADQERTSRWSWLYATRPPARVPGEDRVGFDPSPAAVEALLQRANPDAYVRPGDPRARSWAAVTGDDGRLLACGAVTEHQPGVPHLASIAVAPDARRQGWGTALTVAMTRRLLRGAPAVTLALWAGNTTARALYDQIGLRGGHDYATHELR